MVVVYSRFLKDKQLEVSSVTERHPSPKNLICRLDVRGPPCTQNYLCVSMRVISVYRRALSSCDSIYDLSHFADVYFLFDRHTQAYNALSIAVSLLHKQLPGHVQISSNDGDATVNKIRNNLRRYHSRRSCLQSFANSLCSTSVREFPGRCTDYLISVISYVCFVMLRDSQVSMVH